MRRREFIAGVAAATVWPVVARAQRAAVPVIGWLGAAAPDGIYGQMAIPFRKGLREIGYVDGDNIAIQYRWAGGRYELLPDLVADLIRLRVSAIATSGGIVTILAAKAATRIIPIVFVAGGDPIKSGVVESLNAPSANVTGVSLLAGEVQPKRLELLHKLVPSATTIGVLVNPANATIDLQVRELQAAAATLGLQLDILPASTEAEIETALDIAEQHGLTAVLSMVDGFLVSQAERITTLALRHRIATAVSIREEAIAGGLLSYGPDLADAYRQSGNYIGRILKGARAADLPVIQSTKLMLVINLKTAKALGLTIPETLLATADELIQ
jgi:putative tryptophan/tyrosine transport system substrate-binding protein